MAGRKPLTSKEKADKQAAREAAKKTRDNKLSKMTDEQKKAFKLNERHENFLRLAPKRVTRTLESLRTVGQLSGAGYAYTKEEIEKMFAAINEAALAAYGAFGRTKGAKEESGFKF